MGAHVNLIPINPVDGSLYSGGGRCQRQGGFRTRFCLLGVNATVRRLEQSVACAARREANKEGTPANGIVRQN